jgi:hypothetical protein
VVALPNTRSHSRMLQSSLTLYSLPCESINEGGFSSE